MIPYFGTTGWQIGFLKIQAWGLMVALGFLAGFFLVWRLAKRQKLDLAFLPNLFIWIIAGPLILARLFYVFFEGSLVFFFTHPLEIFKIWQGGLSSFGGFFGAALVLYLFWRSKKINWRYLDILSLTVPFGWAVGRIGCLLIHDHLGILSNSFLAVKFATGSRLDMALLEILMLLPLLAGFAIKGVKLLAWPSLLSSTIFLWYGMGRFFLDFLRATDISFPDAHYLGLTVAQWGCLTLIIFSLIQLSKLYGRKIQRDFNGRGK